MPLLHCYVPDNVAEKLQHKAEQSHLSVSKYLVELVKKDLGTDWPDDFFDLFGAWEGEPLAREEHHNEYVSLDDYLEGERDVDVRNEYVDGQVYATAGASETHNTICTSLTSAIDNTLPEACRVWQSDMKVIGETQGKHFSYYPDIMAACGENEGDQYARTNPVLIVEVLSPSTQRVDMKEKFDNYKSIASLLEYVVVSQDVPLVRIFRRLNVWSMESFYAEDTVELESVGVTIAVSHIYRRVRKEVGLESLLQ